MKKSKQVVLSSFAVCGLLAATTTQPIVANAKAPAKTTKKAPAKTGAKKRVLPGGLIVEDLRVGKGAVAKAGQSVTVHYRGTLKSSGKQFDASYDRGQPFTFMLGGGQVIKGWDEGVAGMKVGGKRRLTIPSALGYGAQGTPGGPIPPNATLVFDVELLKAG